MISPDEAPGLAARRKTATVHGTPPPESMRLATGGSGTTHPGKVDVAVLGFVD